MTSFLLRLPGEPQYVCIARLALSGFASQLGMPFDDVEDLKLAVTEACAHVMRRGGAARFLEVACAAGGDTFEIRVSTPLALDVASRLPTLDVPRAGRDEPTLGMQLIEALMDDVAMEFDERNRRLMVRMQRRLAWRVAREG